MYAARLKACSGGLRSSEVLKDLRIPTTLTRHYAAETTLKMGYATNSPSAQDPERIVVKGINDDRTGLLGDKIILRQNLQDLEDSVPPVSPVPSKVFAAKIEEMNALVTKCTANLPKHRPTRSTLPGEKDTILVTGTTGALGCNLLAQLITSPEVVRVYAVNRTQKGGVPLRTQQASALKQRGFNPELLDSSKLVLMETEMSAQNLGMPNELFQEMRDSITVIIHNAWPVHFLRPLSSFEPVIQGLRNLIDLALNSPRDKTPRLIFASSIGVFQNYASSGPIPEVPVEARSAVRTGYSESKWVAERMLDLSSQSTPLRPISVRCGQLSGGANGAWNIQQWVPLLVRSSQVLGCLPSRQEVGAILGYFAHALQRLTDVPAQEINWLPLHSAAAALIEARHSSAQYLTLAHPYPVPWDTIFKPLSHMLGVNIVPYSKWLATLENGSTREPSAEAIRANPAMRLLEFFKAGAGEDAAATLGLARLSTAEARKASPTLTALGSLTREDVEGWVAYWRNVSFLE